MIFTAPIESRQYSRSIRFDLPSLSFRLTQQHVILKDDPVFADTATWCSDQGTKGKQVCPESSCLRKTNSRAREVDLLPACASTTSLLVSLGLIGQRRGLQPRHGQRHQA
jgi:hypothetical protein